MEKKSRILLAEDDPNFGMVLHDYLELNSYEVMLAGNGLTALQLVQKKDFDLCVLDVMMPEMDGFTLAREIRKKTPALPFIFLTAKTLKADVVEGYRIGADDYITKPFDSEVLLYKIRAIMKRKQDAPKPVALPNDFKIGSYVFNYKLRSLVLKKQESKLSPKEADLLRLLAASMNDVVLRQEALRLIWGEDNFFTGRSMDVFIVKLRKYLKDDINVEIVNIHGNGYRLMVKDPEINAPED